MKTFQGFNLILTDVPSSQIKMRETTEWKKCIRENATITAAASSINDKGDVFRLIFFFFHFSLGRQFFFSYSPLHMRSNVRAARREKKIIISNAEPDTRIHKILTA